MPYPRATRIASTVGQAIALLLGLAGLMLNQMMLLFNVADIGDNLTQP